ncbi:MAG: hypothetical protein ACO1N7_06475 [Sphingobacteriaceae bacterium]
MIRNLALILMVLPLGLFASPQMPDYIIYGKDTTATYNLLLEQYLQRQDTSKTEKLFGLSFRNGSSFSCWRGYQAIYKIENDSLFVVDVINCGELRHGKFDKTASSEKMKTIFGNKLKQGRVYIDWFSGDINIPLSNKLLRWDGVFYKIFEKERVFNIVNGSILEVEDVSNYVEVPGAIDRRDKDKVADILFKRLKKVKWKKADDCDCSEKYMVTIDENGYVQRVRMLEYETDEKISEDWDRKEYDYCIGTMYNALKKMRFDIVRDKGKPFSEDIYIEIWTEDNGRIENWTR